MTRRTTVVTAPATKGSWVNLVVGAVIFIGVLSGVCYGVYDTYVVRPEQKATAEAKRLASPITNEELCEVMNAVLKFEAAGFRQPRDFIIKSMQADGYMTYGEVKELQSICDDIQRASLFMELLMAKPNQPKKEKTSNDRQT